MLTRFLNWLTHPVGRPRSRGQRTRLGGCLLWILIAIGVLVILSLFFGSFQKGTKATGSPAFPPAAAGTNR